MNDDLISFMFHWNFLTCWWVPADRVYAADKGTTTYISLREFVRSVADWFFDGARVEVTVRGRDTDSTEAVEFAGELAYIRTDDGKPPASEPRYDTLGGI